MRATRHGLKSSLAEMMSNRTIKRRLIALETGKQRATGGEFAYSSIEEAERASIAGGVRLLGWQ